MQLLLFYYSEEEEGNDSLLFIINIFEKLKLIKYFCFENNAMTFECPYSNRDCYKAYLPLFIYHSHTQL